MIKTKDFPLVAGAHVAIKVMGITSRDKKQEMENEVEIARYMSGFVERKQTPYFPVVYTAGFCPQVQGYQRPKIEKVGE